MQQSISFLNFPSSYSLQKVIQERMKRISKHHGRREFLGAKVNLRILNNPQASAGPGLHECAIEIDAGRQHLFIKKSKDNMYKAVDAAFKTLDRIVREKIRRKRPKKNH